MLVRRVRLGVVAAACAAGALIAAPSAQAHPEECATGAQTWATVVPFSLEDWSMHATDGTCTPPSSVGRYDDSDVVVGPGEMASRNLELLANIPKTGPFVGASNYNSDLAFWGDLAFQGNYNGFQVTDISDPSDPQVVSQFLCPGSQNDISVWKGLVFLSVDSSRSNATCNNVPQTAENKASWEGIRVIDVSNPASPKWLASVETDCGSHTHTLIPEADRALLYVSSYNPNAAHPDCQPPHDKISIVEVPLDDPASASVIAEPVLFPNGGYDGSNGYTRATAGCHDITVYQAIGLAAGACMGEGILMDISDPENPEVLSSIFDPNFAFWHSATFSNDGKKVLFTDEKGGGLGPECNPTVGPTKGADAIYDIRDPRNPRFLSYFKIPRPQANSENCVAHNGNVLPIPGRDVMVQAWYQGGISVFDWTAGTQPRELAWFDRGPFNPSVEPPTGTTLSGAWSSYWYNGKIYSNEIQLGFDVLDLAGKSWGRTTRDLPYLNAQTQEPVPSR